MKRVGGQLVGRQSISRFLFGSFGSSRSHARARQSKLADYRISQPEGANKALTSLAEYVSCTRKQAGATIEPSVKQARRFFERWGLELYGGSNR